MAQQLTKNRTRTIIKCGKCGSNEIEIRAWVSPNLDNAFSMYYDGNSLEDAETCYCRACGEWTSPLFEQEDIPAINPWRCEECGALNIEQKVWVDPNTGTQTSQDSVDRNECWCNDCEEHTNQVQESELLQTIDDWFKNGLEPDDPEIISGLNFGDFATEEEFDAACKKLWDTHTPEQKIEIWRTITHRPSQE